MPKAINLEGLSERQRNPNQQVRAAPISGNIDNPEGGLDALMQAREKDRDRKKTNLNVSLKVMVCGDRVGWREEARRVIIYTTDQVARLVLI